MQENADEDESPGDRKLQPPDVDRRYLRALVDRRIRCMCGPQSDLGVLAENFCETQRALLRAAGNRAEFADDMNRAGPSARLQLPYHKRDDIFLRRIRRTAQPP